ncbi:MAG: hypothetical protein WBR17_03545 [Paraburkholderia sp.]|uniref:hypothetical protein n=1 Tax=Paraburkholderia sp. TaxID=1926495 RepID=UPI003C319A57
MNLSDVFGVSKQRVLSYLERAAVDGYFVKALASDKHIIVYGSSKQGKTSLVDKHLPYEKNVLVSCTPKFESTDIYKSILRSENIVLETTSEDSTATAAKASVSTKFKALIPFFGSGEAAVGGEISGGSGKKMAFEPVEINLALPQEITKLLEKVGFKKFVILENFHYLSLDVQKALAFDLRSFQELGMRFVILGVWREKNRLTQFNGDLQDRIIEVPVEPWSTSEFREVIRIGSEQLNISISDEIQGRLIESAFDSIGVVQELVKGVCTGAGVEVRQHEQNKIDDPKLLEVAVEKKTEDYAARHLRALEDIAEGRKSKKATEDSIPLYLPYYTVKAWLNFPFDQVVRGIRREQLEESIKNEHHRPKDVRPSDMSNLLHNFAELQSEKGIVPPIFDYDQNSRTMRVVDSTFYFFLRHVDRNAVLSNIESPLDRLKLARPAAENTGIG